MIICLSMRAFAASHLLPHSSTNDLASQHFRINRLEILPCRMVTVGPLIGPCMSRRQCSGRRRSSRYLNCSRDCGPCSCLCRCIENPGEIRGWAEVRVTDGLVRDCDRFWGFITSVTSLSRPSYHCPTILPCGG